MEDVYKGQFVLSINTGPLKTFKARLFALLIVRGEMESGMNDDPFGIKPSRHVNVGLEALVGSLPKEVAEFRSH